MVAPDILSIIVAGSPLHTEVCISSHTLSRKYQIMVRFAGHSELWVFCMELVSCHTSGTYNLEVVPRFLENLWTPVIYREIFYVLH
jgi:hypothetical protein